MSRAVAAGQTAAQRFQDMMRERMHRVRDLPHQEKFRELQSHQE
jgi:hypothetical protein